MHSEIRGTYRVSAWNGHSRVREMIRNPSRAPTSLGELGASGVVWKAGDGVAFHNMTFSKLRGIPPAHHSLLKPALSVSLRVFWFVVPALPSPQYP